MKRGLIRESNLAYVVQTFRNVRLEIGPRAFTFQSRSLNRTIAIADLAFPAHCKGYFPAFGVRRFRLAVPFSQGGYFTRSGSGGWHLKDIKHSQCQTAGCLGLLVKDAKRLGERF